MTPRQYLVMMILTFTAFFAVYIAVMHFLLRLNAGLIVGITVPAAIATGIAASVGYRRWLSQYRARAPRVAAGQRLKLLPLTAQMLVVAGGAFCAVALLRSGHRLSGQVCELFSGSFGIWIVIRLLRKHPN